MPTLELPPRIAPAPAPAAGNGRLAAAPPRPVKKRRNVRRLAWALAAVLLLALVWWAMRPVPVQVETGTVARGPLRVTVDEDGVARVQERYVVAAPVAGRLLRVTLREGDAVAAGDVVARVAAAPLDARTVREARAGVAAAEAVWREAGAALAAREAELAQARRETPRLRALERAGALSRQALEQAETAERVQARAVSAAAARVRAAAADVERARAAVTGADPADLAAETVTEVRSPVSGRVLRVAQESETPVAPGAPLVELGDAAALEVLVDVLSTDAVRIRPGMPVVVEEWGGEGVLQGRVRTVSPSAVTKISALGVEEQRVNVVADLLASAGPLGEGYRVEARIVTWQAENVLKVPLSALFRHGSGWAVFVVDAGRARLRPVTLAHRGEEEAQVLRGLRGGESVILYPSDEIADGVRVRGD
jgi:HlyD family secretion protein